MHGNVGVVVIGRNEGERLVRCLESLQGKSPCIVYVDSGSSDGSCEAAERLGALVVELDMTIPFSMARARNAGFARLKEAAPGAEYVQFVDGDCEVVDGWLEQAIDALAANVEAGVVCGRRRERFPEKSVYNRLFDVEWNTPAGEAASCGGDAMMRVSVFENAGGFNEKLIAGEEPELCLRIRNEGWKIMRIDAEMTLHDANMLHFREWWKRNVRGGYGARDVYERLRSEWPAADVPFTHMTKSAKQWTVQWGIITLVLLWPAGFLFGLPGVCLLLAGALGLHVLQAMRIARGIRERAGSLKMAVLYGAYTQFGKWPQMLGQLKYQRDRKANRPATLIEYKKESSQSAWQQDKARYPQKAFAREQSMWVLAVYRFGRWNDARPRGISKWMFDRFYWFAFRMLETLTGISITKLAEIGPGLRIYHFGNIFIHSSVKMGAGCTLRQGVTIGNKVESGPVPVIGDNVEFGAYAQVLGGIHVGDGATIGAMSVVLQDVPPGATAVGIPARIISATKKEQDHDEPQ